MTSPPHVPISRSSSPTWENSLKTSDAFSDRLNFSLFITSITIWPLSGTSTGGSKTISPTEKRNGVYKIECQDCPEVWRIEEKHFEQGWRNCVRELWGSNVPWGEISSLPPLWIKITPLSLFCSFPVGLEPTTPAYEQSCNPSRHRGIAWLPRTQKSPVLAPLKRSRNMCPHPSVFKVQFPQLFVQCVENILKLTSFMSFLSPAPPPSKLVFCEPPLSWWLHIRENGLSRKCPGDLEEFQAPLIGTEELGLAPLWASIGT